MKFIIEQAYDMDEIVGASDEAGVDRIMPQPLLGPTGGSSLASFEALVDPHAAVAEPGQQATPAVQREPNVSRRASKRKVDTATVAIDGKGGVGTRAKAKKVV